MDIAVHVQLLGKLDFQGIRLLLSKAKPSYVYSILKPSGQSSRSSVRLLLSEANPSYVYSSRSAVRLLLSEAKPSYVYSILKPHGQSSRSQSDRCWARRSQATYTQFQSHMVRGLETQTVAPNSISFPLHVVLDWNKRTLTLPCSVAVWLGIWNPEHNETW